MKRNRVCIFLCLVFTTGALYSEAAPVLELNREGLTSLSGSWNYRYDGSWQSTVLPARFDPGQREYPQLQLELLFSVPAELAGRRLYLLLGKRWGPVQAFINGVEVLHQGSFYPDYHYHEARRVNAPVPEGLLRYGAENRLYIRFGHERDRTYVTPPAFGFDREFRYYEGVVNFINVDLYRYLAFLSLFVAGFYLMQFLVRPKERSTLIFALVNLGLTVYFARIGHSFPSLPLLRSFGVSKAVFFPTITLMTTFLADYLNARGLKRFMPLFWLTSTVSFIALSFFGNTSLDIDRIFTVSLLPVAAEVILMVVIATRAFRRRNPDALPVLVAVYLGGVIAFHDLLYMLLGLYPDWWIQGVAFFIFDMGVFASLAVRSMRLHDELEEYSGRIEQKVLDRTRELQRTNKDLYDAVEAARHASQAKSRFLANISHEMRTPLNCIIGFSEMLGRSATEHQHKNLEVILEESERLLTLINQLLDIEKIEAGKISLDAAPFNLEDFLSGISNSFAFHCAGKGLLWRVVKDESVPVLIEADSFRLRQVLDNLISNAVKFTSEGSVVLEVTVEKEYETRDIDLRFSVTDTGIGIRREQCEIIFDSFEQGDSSRTRLYGGTGLGTTIAKQLVTLMRGEIAVESEVGYGSTFWFTLPCRVPVDNSFTASMAPAALQPARIAGSPRVLVVEDYAPNRVITRSHLESAGCSVEEAATGKQAVSMAEGGGYDLILMDIQMPEMDGVEATRAIRTSLAQRRIPIVGLTANAFPEDIRLYREAGMDGVLTKPLRRDLFLSNVASWLAGDGEQGSSSEVCDLEALKAEMEGDRGQVLTILRAFDAALAEQLPRIESACARADWELLHRELHSIKGGALNIFARELSGAAAPAERAAKEQRGEELSRLLPELIRAVRSFHSLVEELDL